MTTARDTTNNSERGFPRLAGALWQRRYLLLTIWLLFFILGAVGLGFSSESPDDEEGIGTRGTEAWVVRDTIQKEFGTRIGNQLAVVLPRHLATEALARDLRARFPVIVETRQQQRPDAALQILSLEFRADQSSEDIEALTPALRQRLQRWEHANGVAPLLTGHASFMHDAKASGKRDSRQSESVALVLALAVLIYTFGSLSAAILPLLMGISALVSHAWLAHWLGWPSNQVAQILTSLLGLALSIDYSLFIVSRFREDLTQGSAREALITALAPTGRTIVYSGLIMVCSLSALFMPDVAMSRIVVSHLLLVIGIAMLHALFVLPVLLAVGHRWLSWPAGLGRLLQRERSVARWRRFSAHVVNHYRVYFLFSLVTLGALSLPLTRMQLWEPIQSTAPRDAESVQAFDQLLKDGWGGQVMPVVLLASHPDSSVYQQDFLVWLQGIVKQLQARPEVLTVQAIVDTQESPAVYQGLLRQAQVLQTLGLESPLQALINDSGDKTLLRVIPRDPLDYAAVTRLISFSRQELTSPVGIRLQTGGVAARKQDFTRELYRYTLPMLLLIVGGIYLLLWWHMKTVILPLKAAVMNFMPIIASFGVLILLYQDGWGETLLGMPASGGVSFMVPVVLFCIVFGLSMDYEILILSRISEEYQRHGDVREAIIEGLARSGAVITGAVLILLGVFLPGCFLASPQIQEICIGITAAILLDATVVRLFLVPSFMMLMGKWNWAKLSDMRSQKRRPRL